MPLNITEKMQQDIKILTLDGNLDEDFDYLKLLSYMNHPHIVLDLKRIKKITSYGVKQWISFQKEIKDDIKIEYYNCAIVFVEQANMISNFIAKGKIVTFYAPYICDKGHEYQQLLSVKELKKDSDGEYEMIIKKCEICGVNAELDDYPSDYFLFND